MNDDEFDFLIETILFKCILIPFYFALVNNHSLGLNFLIHFC
jgi:hypothetical protein